MCFYYCLGWYLLCQENIKIGYFTYSKHLVEQSKNLFKSLCKHENKSYEDNIIFNDLNSQYCPLLGNTDHKGNIFF